MFSKIQLFRDLRGGNILSILQKLEMLLAWKKLRIWYFSGIEYTVRYKLTQIFLSNFLVNWATEKKIVQVIVFENLYLDCVNLRVSQNYLSGFSIKTIFLIRNWDETVLTPKYTPERYPKEPSVMMKIFSPYNAQYSSH